MSFPGIGAGGPGGPGGPGGILGTRGGGLAAAAGPLISGILLGCSFPPFETGVLAAFGLVPLLLSIDPTGPWRTNFLKAYGAFLVFNLITLYWPGGYVHGKDLYLMIAGALLLIVHPLFFTLPVLAWTFTARRAGLLAASALLPFYWVAFELLHTVTQLSFPWLILGTSHSYTIAALQPAVVTGIYGISFWLVTLNSLIFTIARSGLEGGTGRVAGMAAAALALYIAPFVWGSVVIPAAERPGDRAVRIGIVQPDIDPFMKWEGGDTSQLDQVGLLESMTRTLARERPDVIAWPETAIPFFLTSPLRASDLERLHLLADSLDVPILTGSPDFRSYDSSDAPASAYRTTADGRKYETFNAAILLTPGSRDLVRYGKHLLVPFAERVPFSDLLSILNAARWNFGLGGWSPGRDTTLFRIRSGEGSEVPFTSLICYESAFPGYVAGGVRKGAGFIMILTNDSWWGDTAGPYQHERFAVARAIENRRWVIQCANGGISFVVDPYGRVVTRTELFTRTTLLAEIAAVEGLTLYSRHGDWFGYFCVITAALGFFLTIRRSRREPAGAL